jgi:hypothetical protein
MRYGNGRGGISTITGNAGQRNPRGQGPAFRPIQGDPRDLEANFDIEAQLRRAHQVNFDPKQQLSLQEGPPPIPTGPEAVVVSTYPVLIAGLGIAVAQNIVPKNLNRRGLKVSNPSNNGQISFSFNSPSALTNDFGSGIGVSAGDVWEENGPTISVDTIYVWSDDVTATFPIPVAIFESVPVGS